jgi:copper chaperone
MTQAFRVTGMTCEGCVRAVTNAIRAQAPGAKVSVDLSSGTVTIAGAIDAKTIAGAIEGAGFGFGGAV